MARFVLTALLLTCLGSPARPAAAFRSLGEAVPAFADLKYADLYQRSRRVAGVEAPAADQGA